MTKSSSQQRAGHSSQSAPPAVGFNRWLLLSLILVVVAVAAVFGLRAYHLNTYTIPSASMLPGLQIGDRIEIDPEAYQETAPQDRTSTRLNSSHVAISHAVFCW